MSIVNARNQTKSSLPLEDGVPAARVLSFDVMNADKPFETATFGLG